MGTLVRFEVGHSHPYASMHFHVYKNLVITVIAKTNEPKLCHTVLHCLSVFDQRKHISVCVLQDLVGADDDRFSR